MLPPRLLPCIQRLVHHVNLQEFVCKFVCWYARYDSLCMLVVTGVTGVEADRRCVIVYVGRLWPCSLIFGCVDV